MKAPFGEEMAAVHSVREGREGGGGRVGMGGGGAVLGVPSRRGISNRYFNNKRD